MQCLSPVLTYNKRFDRIELTDESLDELYKYVPCGTCIACRKNKASQWRTRLLNEVTYGGHTNSVFITFTLDNDALARFGDNPKRPIRLFLERYRAKYGKSCKHWFITELGSETRRLHFHGIIFSPACSYEELRRLWRYGFCWFGYVSEKTASYITKYLLKLDDYTPRIFASPGIGSAFLSDSTLSSLRSMGSNATIVRNGSILTIPRYYYLKIFPKNSLSKLSLDIERYISAPRYTLNGRTYIDYSAFYHAISTVKNMQPQKFRTTPFKSSIYALTPQDWNI